MTDPAPGMIGHIELKLRLVFETGTCEATAAPCPSQHQRSDNPGWRLTGVLPEAAVAGEAEVPPGSRRSASHPIGFSLDRDEAEGYYLNLTSPQPSLFVLLRQQDVASATALHSGQGPPEAEAVTASYNEASRWMDGGMVVVRTALPEPMLAWIAEFAQHHFPVEGKRKRGGFRPSFLSRRDFGAVTRLEQSDGR